jgi:hypothetical protein
MANEMMQMALEYEAKGYSVIPLKPRDKIPLIPSWTEFQTERADRVQIGEWWRTWPNANIGIVTGQISGLFVIDTDSSEAATNLKPLLGDMTDVGIAATGKGFHLYYAHGDHNYPNKAAIREHVDFRGDGGYVVAPPSVHPNGKRYEWSKPLNGHLRELPTEFIALMTAPAENRAKTSFDTRAALSGLPAGQRDEGVFKLACKLRGADVPYDLALSLCEEAAANCVPPFRDAKRKVDQAYKYKSGHTEPAGQQAFWPEIKSAKDALIQTPDTERWLWHRCLPLGSCSMLVAKAKVGKSTVAVNLAIAVSRGYNFLGRETIRAPVVYLFLDGPADDIKDQFQRAGIQESDQIWWHAGAMPDKAVKWAAETIAKVEAKLLVVDTLQKFFKFKDLNDYAEVANTMEPLLSAAQVANCHVLFLHHASKFALDEMDAAIGSSVLKGQAYSNIHLKKLPGSEIRILRSEQRGGRNLEEISIGYENDTQTGLMVTTGTRAQAEIKAVEPAIIGALTNNPMTETELQVALGARAILVSMAIRGMLKRGELETTGVKRSRIDPLKWHVASRLSDQRDSQSE